MKEYLNDKNVKIPFPFTHKNETYGKLTELYDRIKNFELPENSKKLFFEIHFITHEVTNYAMSTELEDEKREIIYRMLEVINDVKHCINGVSKNDISNLEDAFNFDLGNKPIKYIKGASKIKKRIEKAIEPKKKNNAGKPKAQCKEITELLINKDEDILVASDKKTALKNYIEDNFSGCSAIEFNRLIAVLEFNKDIDFDNNKKEIQLSFEKFLKPKGYNKVESNEKETAQPYQNCNKQVKLNFDSLKIGKNSKQAYNTTGVSEKKYREMDKILTDLNKNNL